MQRHTPQGSPQPPRRWPLGVAVVVVALLLHAALLPLVVHELNRIIPNKNEARPPIRLVALSPEEMQRIRARENDLKHRKHEPSPKQELANQEKKDNRPDKLDGTVVEVPPSRDDAAPDNARYLSEHNSRTEREQKSRYAGNYQNVMHERTVASRGELSSPAPQRDNTALDVGPKQPEQERKNKGKGNEAAFELPRVRQRDRLALKLDPSFGQLANQSPSERLDGNGNRLRLALGEKTDQPAKAGSAPKQAPQVAKLIPEAGVLASLTGGPQSEHLEDVEEGEGTFLNTREFKYASFFNRMKRGVRAEWRWEDEYRRRDPSGNIYGYRSRVTVLQVTLNPDGSLKQVELLRSSGLDFLDYAAIAAFKRAEPFPNPPRGLVEGGSIAFPFSFYIDFSPGVQLPF